jgi:Neurotransmitter-gated ion-channel ligand binding domain
MIRPAEEILALASRGTGVVIARCLLLAGMLWCSGAGEGACAAGDSRADTQAPPTTVRIYLFLRDVFAVSGSDQTLEGDVSVVAEWDDPLLVGRWPAPRSVGLDEIWHPTLVILNRRDASPLLPQRLLVQPSGRVQYQQRWSGRFSTPMDLRDFPLDQQRFSIQLVSLAGPAETLSLVPFSADRPSRARHFSITDWSMGPAVLKQDNVELSPGMRRLPGVSLSWEGQRHHAYYLAGVMLPLVLIVFMGWTALLQDRSTAAARITVASTAMLTLIAYRFSLGSELPNLSYLTRFDYFMSGSTILVFMVLVLVTVSARLISAGSAELVNRLDRWARFGFPAAFVAMTLLVLTM